MAEKKYNALNGSKLEYSTTENGRMDVKFVDINNNYKDPVTDEETSWKELQSQGYQPSSIFPPQQCTKYTFFI